jgi:DNA-directed RNA polymerase specialized sigma24 family protein
MSDVTELLDAAAAGDRQAAADLLPLVYDELRKLAAARLASEAPDHTLQPTALVHEVYLRLVGEPTGRAGTAAATSSPPRPRPCAAFSSKPPAARSGSDTEAGSRRGDLPADGPAIISPVEDVVAVDEALEKLAAADPQAAELVKLHYFAGLTIEQAAAVLKVSVRKAYTIWAFARAWLFRCLGGEAPPAT